MLRLILIFCVFLWTELGAQEIRLNPQVIRPGSPVLIELAAPTAKSVDGELLGQGFKFFRAKDSLGHDEWFALVGVDVEAKAEPVELKLTVYAQDGATTQLTRTIEIAPSHYLTKTLSVAPKFVSPSPEAQKQIADERELKSKLFAAADSAVATQPMWRGNFMAPVSAPATDSFGTRRVFRTPDGTEKVDSIHRGMDFRAPMGTPVRAVNAGTVILAQPLYLEGNCVIVDHGFGLQSSYLHLSRIDVKAGDYVEKGQLLGLSGATGRVTGPHLHLAVRFQNSALDPAQLLRLQLPSAF